MGKDYSAYFQVGGFLYGIAGIPVIHGIGVMYYLQLAYLLLVLCGYLILTIIGLYFFMTEEEGPSTSGYVHYVNFHWVLYPFSCALVSINLAFNNKSIFRTFTETERISQEMAKAGAMDKNDLFRNFIKFTVALISILSTILCCTESSWEVFIMDTRPVHTTGVIIRYLTYLPSIFFFWVILYHSALQYLYELDFITDIMNAMFELIMSESGQSVEEDLPLSLVTDGSFRTLDIRQAAAVLPPELRSRCVSGIRLDPSLLSAIKESKDAGPASSVSSTNFLGSSVSDHNSGIVTDPTQPSPSADDLSAMLKMVGHTHGDRESGEEEGSNDIYIYRSSWNVSLLPHRKLLDIYIQVKKLQHLSNSVLHVSLYYILFISAWYLPILLGSLGKTEGRPMFELVSKAYIILGTVGKLAPIVLKQLVKYKEEVFMHRLSAEVSKTTDPYLKKALVKFVNCIKSSYDSSPCFLLDLDASVLPILFDAMLLMITTFYDKGD